MADIIQGQLTIVHKVEDKAPTQAKSPTIPTSQFESTEPRAVESNIDEKVARRALAKPSIQRRLINQTLVFAERSINRKYNEAMFNESIKGDLRGVKKIQNEKAVFNFISNNAKAISGSVVTYHALGKNPAIAVLQVVSLMSNFYEQASNKIQERSFFETRRDMEMFTANMRRERLNVGVYNRR